MDENNKEVVSEVEENKDSLNSEKTAVLTKEELEEMLASERASGRGQGVLFTLIGIAAIALIIFVIFVAAKGTTKNKSSKLADDRFVTKTEYLWGFIDKYYLWDEDIDKDAAKDAMFEGLMDSLGDPYTTYYTKKEFDDLEESSSGEYSGIGAYISQNVKTDECFISRPMPGSPAEEVGLKANDYIYEVDGENVVGQDINLVVSKIKGPKGTTVKIGVKHENEGEIETFTVERRTIEVTRIESEMLEDNIGYIWIYEFEGKTLEQFNKSYDELKSQGMDSLIIDLRDNPGGDLDVVTKLADKFLDEGVICYTKTKKGKGDVYKSDSACEKLPIVILTNANSASASEILTGSLKDRGVATVVGTNTFGKGIVQAVFGLSDGSGLKITESEYYLPNDECIHGVGIAPDVEAELDVDAYKKDGTDTQKQKAIEVMKELKKK